MADDAKPTGPDLTKGIPSHRPRRRRHAGRPCRRRRGAAGAPRQARFSRSAAHCSHYHGPLAEGLLVGDTVRCPWHHACFSLRTGEALHAAGAEPDRLLVGRAARRQDLREGQARRRKPARAVDAGRPAPDRIVIVGGGAAGFAAAEMLRRQDYNGSIVMLSDDDAAPVDRPNLSKDYLAGNAPEEWMPLRARRASTPTTASTCASRPMSRRIDPRAREVLARRAAARLAYDRLLLATGAEPVRLRDPGRRPGRTCTRCARWPTAAPSSSGPRPRRGRS